jgi:hypothetical protein
MFTVPFDYRGGGLYPAVGFVSPKNAVVFINHFEPMEHCEKSQVRYFVEN